MGLFSKIIGSFTDLLGDDVLNFMSDITGIREISPEREEAHQRALARAAIKRERASLQMQVESTNAVEKANAKKKLIELEAKYGEESKGASKTLSVNQQKLDKEVARERAKGMQVPEPEYDKERIRSIYRKSRAAPSLPQRERGLERDEEIRRPM